MAVLFYDHVIFHTTRPGLITVRWRKTTVVAGTVVQVTPWSTTGVVEVRAGNYYIPIPIEDTDPELTLIEVDTGEAEPFGRVIKAMEFDPTKLAEVSSGGGVLKLKIAESSLDFDDYLEVVQGEEKSITFIVEAVGRFTTEVADVITAKFADSADTIISKSSEDGDIERVCQELDVQIIRVSLAAEDTLNLLPGLIKIELAFDDQKARGTHALKVVEGIIPES